MLVRQEKQPEANERDKEMDQIRFPSIKYIWSTQSKQPEKQLLGTRQYDTIRLQYQRKTCVTSIATKKEEEEITAGIRCGTDETKTKKKGTK